MEGTKTEKNSRLNLKMIIISAGILCSLFVVNVAMVVHAVHRYGDTSEPEENIKEENIKAENEVNRLGESVRIGADYLKKHGGKIYVSEEGKRYFNVDYLHFAMYCNGYSITHDINEVGSLGGFLPSFIGELDVRDFIYDVEDGKECFVSEKEKFKFVYDESQEKWSVYSNTDNLTSAEGCEAGEWVLLCEYYPEEEVKAALKAAEEAEINAKIEVLKNTAVQLQAGENTVTINPIDGYLPYNHESDGAQNGKTVVAVTKASSYEDMLGRYSHNKINAIVSEEVAIAGDYSMTYNLIYSIRDSVEDTITIPDTGEVVSAEDIVREVVQDSEGNEIIVLEGAHSYGYELEWRQRSIEVYEYTWLTRISAQDAYEALGYEGEFHYANIKPAVREYYKKLENGKYLCLTIENYDMYYEAYYLGQMFAMMVPEESNDLYWYATGSDTYSSYLELVTPPVPHDEFIRFLEDDCYTYE